MKRTVVAACLALSCAVTAYALGAPTAGAAAPTPIPQPSQTPPPDVASSPTPLPLVASGQLIDIEGGFIVFSSGDALRLSPTVKIVDDVTGAAPAYLLSPGLFAAVMLDPQTSLVVAVRVARKPIAAGIPVAAIPHRYVAELSSPRPNPDLEPPKATYTSQLSKTVGVAITVETPPDTPFFDDVFMTTDTSGWNPQAVRMARIDGRHFRIQIDLRGGTEIHYLFTRGTWSTVERDRSGLQRPPRRLFVPGGDAMTVSIIIQRWADLP